MEFVYFVSGDVIEVYIPSLTGEPVRLSKEWANKLAQNLVQKSGLDYDTAFGIVVYLGYLKTVWAKG
jgi:hypothetical protein